MTRDQLLDAINELDDGLLKEAPLERSDTRRRYTDNNFYAARARSLKHCKWMLNQMRSFIREGRFDKVQRWLGFIQGALWATGVGSIDNFKEMNRKKEDGHAG